MTLSGSFGSTVNVSAGEPSAGEPSAGEPSAGDSSIIARQPLVGGSG